jgi:hypothetical protein
MSYDSAMTESQIAEAYRLILERLYPGIQLEPTSVDGKPALRIVDDDKFKGADFSITEAKRALVTPITNRLPSRTIRYWNGTGQCDFYPTGQP